MIRPLNSQLRQGIPQALLWAAALLVGCGNPRAPGGGGSTSVPPADFEYGRPAAVREELSVWGGGSPDAGARFTDLLCHYRAENWDGYAAAPGRVERTGEGRIFVAFDLPPFGPADGAFVEYYLDHKFDGRYNKRDVERVPLRPATRPAG